MNKYEESLRGWGDTDDDRPGPLPHRDYAEFVGGPLDVLLPDLTGWTADEIQTCVALMTELGSWAPAAAPCTTHGPASGTAGRGSGHTP
ncbi:hypothetical protein ACPXCP_34400 [Streptomyces sp. DT20]|uniref:hypothetical protein n=1 Tax=Streptomyces sp. DT20 TaxID=3416519 RepID=UPI003CF7A017